MGNKFWIHPCRYCGTEIKWLGSYPPIETGYGLPHDKLKCADNLRLMGKEPNQVFRKIDRESRGLD
jgi:hypothetical protein